MGGPGNALVAELGEILAAGLMRVWERKSSGRSAETGESSLDLSGTKSGHPTRIAGRTSDA
jgi:hypothetical protein